MNDPRFRLLDVVQIKGGGPLSGLAGRKAVIARVRRYPDGTYRYEVGSRDEEVGGLYSEQDLESTGERESIELFQLPGPFRQRDVVRISSDYSERDAAGRLGVIDGSYVGDDDDLRLGVWIQDLQRGFAVPTSCLTGTGERRPPPPRTRSASSSRVTESGDVLGHESYEIVDDIEHFL